MTEALNTKLDAVIHAHAVIADEVNVLARAQPDTEARLGLIEGTLATATATARVAMQAAIDLRADMQRSIGDLSRGIGDRLEKLERSVAAMGTSNEAHAATLVQTLGETRRQTPLIRDVRGRTARYAALASAFGTGLAYAVAELIRHFIH